MWESRPLPKIVRDPLAALSARGSFFVPAPPGIFLLWGRDGVRTTLPCALPALKADRTCRQADKGGIPQASPEGKVMRVGRQALEDLKKGKVCGEGNFFGKRFSLPAPLPSKNFCRWACVLPLGLRMDGIACGAHEVASLPGSLYPAPWKFVPFEVRKRWRKEKQPGLADAIPGQSCQVAGTDFPVFGP